MSTLARLLLLEKFDLKKLNVPEVGLSEVRKVEMSIHKLEVRGKGKNRYSTDRILFFFC